MYILRDSTWHALREYSGHYTEPGRKVQTYTHLTSLRNQGADPFALLCALSPSHQTGSQHVHNLQTELVFVSLERPAWKDASCDIGHPVLHEKRILEENFGATIGVKGQGNYMTNRVGLGY